MAAFFVANAGNAAKTEESDEPETPNRGGSIQTTARKRRSTLQSILVAKSRNRTELKKETTKVVSTKLTLWPPDNYKYLEIRDDVEVEYTFELNFIQKIFVLFDKPESCILATYLTGAMMIVIMVSCLVYILSSDPGLMHKPDTCSDPACDDDPQFCPGYKICAPESARVFNVLEVTCVSIFIVDYFTRVALVPFVPSRVAGVLPSNWDIAKASVDTPDPVLPYHVQILKYAAKPMNVVDLVAILPFFIGFVSSDVGSFSITRIIRLVRVLRVFRIGSMKKFLAVLTTTFRASTTALSILLFFAMLLVILFAAIIFILEQGEFVVNEDFPDGAYVRWDALKSEKEESPFKSILVSCYWAIVTTTTVGYGDLYPTSPIGRTVSVVLMFTGILIIALPVGVIGSAFSKAFEEMEEKDKANEMRLLQEDMNTTEDEEVPSTRHEMILAMEDMAEKLSAMLAILREEEQVEFEKHRRSAKLVKNLEASTSSTTDNPLSSELVRDSGTGSAVIEVESDVDRNSHGGTSERGVIVGSDRVAAGAPAHMLAEYDDDSQL